MNKLIIMLPRIHEVFTKGLLGRVRPGERMGRFLSYCHGGQTWNLYTKRYQIVIYSV